MSGSPRPLGISLPNLEEFSTLLRTMFINVGFFAATILLIPSIAGQFTRSSIVIDPIAVPEAMVTQGLTPEVVANRLWDGLQAFAATASANRETIAAIPDSQLVEFSLPDAGISIDSVFTQVRQFFQIYETRIGGEYTCATPACAPGERRLRLRVVTRSSDVIDLPEMGARTEHDYYRQAAAGIYEIIDPYVAIAAQAETAPLKAATLARGLIIDGGRGAKWAHNLIGDIEMRGGKAQIAIGEYQAALAIDADFHVARAGLAHALLVAGRPGEAASTLTELEQRAPGSALVPVGRSEILLLDDKVDEAVAQLRLAAQLEPLEPDHLRIAGNILLRADRLEDGVALLREALTIDPGDEPALNLLADTLWHNGRQEEAEAVYRQWLEFDPANAYARGSLGAVLASRDNLKEAIDNLEIAYRAGERGEAVLLSRATTLFKLQRYEKAALAFEDLAEATPKSWDIARVLAQTYLELGRKQDAAATYRRFIDATPLEDPNRADAEARLAATGQ